MLQWRGNYPSREIVIADIEQGNSYVCTDDTEEIIGTFAFIRGNDPTYTHIYEGKWVEDTLPKVKQAADVEIVGLIVSLNRMEVGKGGEKCALDEVKDRSGSR